MDWFRHRRERGRPRHPDILTPAEWRVLEHIREGATNAETAVRLGVSINTVRYHVSSMLAKLELRDRRELAAWQGEPQEASRTAIGRSALAAPFAWVREAWVGKVAVGASVVAVSVVAVVVMSQLQGGGNGAIATPTSTPPTATATVAEPTLTPRVTPNSPLPAVFCDVSTEALVQFERRDSCASGVNGFASVITPAVDAAVPRGTIIPHCLQAGTGPGEEHRVYTINLDGPCVSSDVAGPRVHLEGYSVPGLISNSVPGCSTAMLDGGASVGPCVWPPGSTLPMVLEEPRATEFLIGLRSCSAEIGAHAELAMLYEPVIDALTAMDAGGGSIQAVAASAVPVREYEFDEHVPAEGVRVLHTDALAAVDDALADPTDARIAAALGQATELHAIAQQGRGCGG